MALNITKGIVFKAQKVVIYGPEGIGKSSFAAHFPEPLFIDTEGSTNLMDVARLPRPTSWTMMLQMIKEVKMTPDCCKTLVIDTIDWAEQMCVAHVCATYNKKSVEEFGYGKGYVYVKEEFGRFLNLLQDVIDAKINIVLTAHTQIRKFEQPNEAGSYDRYELKLGSKSGSQTAPLVKEWADMVLFANYKTLVMTVDNKKKAQGGERVMYTTHHPTWDAKNRHSLKPELPFSYAEIGYCIPGDSAEKTTLVHATESKGTVAKTDSYFYHAESESYWMLKKGDKITTDPSAEMSAEITKEEYEKGMAAKLAAKQSPENKPEKQNVQPLSQPTDAKTATSLPVPPQPDHLPSVPKALADLMAANDVTVDEIQNVVIQKGYYPQGTPIANYDPGFIDGVLVGAWPQVLMAIQFNRSIPF